MLLGVSSDPTFGRVLTVGLDGVHTEISRDVAFRLPPVGRADCLEMLEELHEGSSEIRRMLIARELLR